MNPISIRYSLYLLAFTAAWILMEHFAGFNSTNLAVGEYTHNVAMILFWILIFFVVAAQRKQNEGALTFQQGFVTAFQFVLIYSIGFTLLIAFYSHFVNPGYYEAYKTFTLDKLNAQNATQKTIDAAMQEVDRIYNGSAISYFMMFSFSIMFGVALSVIAALAFIRKRA